MNSDSSHGFTLIEMMIVVAILAIVTAIAMPLYNGYIETSQMGAIRATADPLRLALEDFRIDNSTYKAGGQTNLTWTNSGANTGMAALGWRPEGQDIYDYQVTAADNNYTLIVRHRLDNTWLRCENRMSKCCMGTTGSPPAACP